MAFRELRIDFDLRYGCHSTPERHFRGAKGDFTPRRSRNNLHGFFRPQKSGQRAAVELDAEIDVAGRLLAGHSHGVRAKGASGEARLRRGQKRAVAGR